MEHRLKMVYPILAQSSVSTPPENFGKPLIFWRFQGV